MLYDLDLPSQGHETGSFKVLDTNILISDNIPRNDMGYARYSILMTFSYQPTTIHMFDLEL